MSSSTPPSEGHPVPRAWYAPYRLRTALEDWVLSWGLVIGASAVWFLFGTRLMYRFGPDNLGPAAGVMAAAAAGVTLWFLAVRDQRRASIDADRCPRCAASIARFEEQPRPGALDRGLRGWRCESCGLEGAEPLTPARNAP